MNLWIANGLSLLLVGLFVSLEIFAVVTPMDQFSWISFSDNDDAYQTEQLLRLAGQTDVPALLDNPVSHGSELLWLAPVYKAVSKSVGGMDPLRGFQFLKIVHIVSAGIGLLGLAALFRQTRAPLFAAPLTIALAASHPLFFTNAPLLKADSNVVFLCMVLSVWGLFKYDDSGGRKWLLFSIFFAALGAATKWWGVFLIPSIVFVHYDRVRRFGPWPSFRLMSVLCAFGALLWTIVLLRQKDYVGAHFSEYSSYLPSIPLIFGAMGTSCLIFLITIHWAYSRSSNFKLQDNRGGRSLDNATGGKTSSTRFFPALLFSGLSMVGMFVFIFTLCQWPLLMGPEFPHSVKYFSKFLLVSPTHTGPETSLVYGFFKILILWVKLLLTSGFIRWTLIPVVLGSAYLYAKGWREDVNSRKGKLIALIVLSLVGILFPFVAKNNPPTLSMILPFVLAMIFFQPLTPSASVAKSIRSVWMILGWGLCLITVGLQARETSEVIMQARSLPQRIQSANEQLRASLPDQEISYFIGHSREFPWSEDIPVHRMSADELVSEFSLMETRCLQGDEGAGERFVVVLLKKDQYGALSKSVIRLEQSPCVRGVWDLDIPTVTRGYESQLVFRGILCQL